MPWTILIGLAFFSFVVIGAFLIYSSITGKGISPPHENSSILVRAQFKMRGIVGIVFFVFGIVMLWKLLLDVFS